MADINPFKLDFDEAIDFFKNKIRLPTASWTDIWQQQHDTAFVVAGAMRDDMLADFQTAIMKALQGSTLEEFRKDFDSIVAKYGWDYNGVRNWRSRVIYETNLDTAYASGRYQKQQQFKKTRPYWQYWHSPAVENARPEHLSWHGTILPADHPWWKTHYGPNGWGCKCRVRSLSKYDLESQELTISEDPETIWEDRLVGTRGATPRMVQTPQGIDPGFAYNPGAAYYKAHALRPATTLDKACNTANDPCNPWKSYFIDKLNQLPRIPAIQLPKQEYDPKQILPQELTDLEYLAIFMNEFNAKPEDIVYFEDVIDEKIPISKDLFLNRKNKKEEELKIDKNGRGKYLILFANTIKSPQEIWIDLVINGKKLEIRIRYLKIYTNKNGYVAC
mgnify:FL=1